MTYATVHLHLTPYPAPTSLGPVMSTMARELETITTAKTQALELHVQREALRQGIPVRIAQTTKHWPGGLADNAWRGRVSDLCVPGLSPDSAEPRLYVEDWLFGSGRPCILYPDDTTQPFSSESVLICWDYSKSAARTVSDGLPFLHNAKRVRVAVFRGEKDIRVTDPMTPLVTFLADHGVKVEAEDVTIGKLTIGVAILEHANATGTNLIMMAAFGHSRLHEFLRGGATRELLAKSTTPLFMSH